MLYPQRCNILQLTWEYKNRGGILGFEIGDIKGPKELGKYLKKRERILMYQWNKYKKETKIRKYIAAIEKGDFSAIPGGDVYIRGF